MNQIIKETESLCRKCLEVVPAVLTDRMGSIWISKVCPNHGHQETMIERSTSFWFTMHSLQDPEPYHSHFDVCMIPVTDRCNIRCPHCYHIPGHVKDPPIEEIVNLVNKTPISRSVILMGAEPTVRSDLPRMILNLVKTGRLTYIYTNGIRLADEKYLRRLKAAGLKTVCFSLHTKTYTPGWDKKLEALKLLAEKEFNVDHIAFTMRNMLDLEEILLTAREYWNQPDHFRIRIPSKIGICRDETFFMSDFMPKLLQTCSSFGWLVDVMPADNNSYHMMVNIAGKPFRIIRWPSVDEVDLGELDCPPTCLFVPELGEVNFVHGALVQEAIKKRGIPIPKSTVRNVASIRRVA